MNSKSIDVLEYGKIIARLRDEAGSEITKVRISELLPMTDPVDIREGWEETSEAAALIVQKGPLPLGNFYDVADLVAFSTKGGSLSMAELLRIRYDLFVARSVKTFMKSDVPESPLLMSMVEVLEEYRDLEEDIERSILSESEMSDHASSELHSIRRQIVQKNEAIKTKLEQFIHKGGSKTYLQDAIVTVRDGRYVIPVKQEHRSMVPGIVHDQSSSGQTLFIEPQAIVNLNNDLRQLEGEEQAEIARILQELSERVAEHHSGIVNNQELLARLDFIQAKGRLALAMEATSPRLSEGRLELRKARHPLIDPEKVVPIDIALGQEEGQGHKALIITGPNTGGKTVSLKTCGLLAMMAQSGLHIPAGEGSRLPVYRDIFADIGDEQSIEQSLSTFSSHMTNIVAICREAGPGTLVLVDELGAGTDPTEGAALAISILEDLIDKGAQVLATTHYTELKKYALTKEGVENASMQFDVESLRPTYKLLVGMPGKSNAFEISQKLGLAPELIGKAQSLLDTGAMEFEDVLGAIELDRKAAEAERDEAVLLNVEMKRLREEAAAEKEKLAKQKEGILAEARREAAEMVQEAKDFSEEIREELKELAKKESLGERNKGLDESRRRIKDAAGRYKEKYVPEVNSHPARPEELKEGMWVKVVHLQQNGEVLSLPNSKEELMVRLGNVKMRVKVKDLMVIPDGRPGQGKKDKSGASGSKNPYGSLYRAKTQSVSPEVDVRGQRAEEAVDNVSKYLDDAVMAGLKEVTIIHGRGEGILQKFIRDELKHNKHVKSARRGGHNEGGDGVTVVQLK